MGHRRPNRPQGVKSESDVEILRNDLRQLHKWSKDWEMLFNLDKCVAIHSGTKNEKRTYELGRQNLKNVEQERDLEIILCIAVGKLRNSVIWRQAELIKF